MSQHPLLGTRHWPWLALLVLVLAPARLDAYIGPGTGLGALGALLAIIATLLVAVVGFIWYPLKRLLRRGRRVDPPDDSAR